MEKKEKPVAKFETSVEEALKCRFPFYLQMVSKTNPSVAEWRCAFCDVSIDKHPKLEK